MNKYIIRVGATTVENIYATHLHTAVTKAIKFVLKKKKEEGIKGYEAYLCRGGIDPKSITILSCTKV